MSFLRFISRLLVQGISIGVFSSQGVKEISKGIMLED